MQELLIGLGIFSVIYSVLKVFKAEPLLTAPLTVASVAISYSLSTEVGLPYFAVLVVFALVLAAVVGRAVGKSRRREG